MEKITIDSPYIRELTFDATQETLEIVFRSGDRRVLHHVCRSGFERFIGRTGE